MSEVSYNESDNEHLFPHPDDDIDLSIDCYDWDYRRWYKTSVDLEHVHREENAERMETEYFTLLSGSYCEMEDAVPIFRHKSLFHVQCVPAGVYHFHAWRRDYPYRYNEYYDEYCDKLQQLKYKVVWRINVDKHINWQYEATAQRRNKSN